MEILFKGSSQSELNKILEIGKGYSYKEIAKKLYSFQEAINQTGICNLVLLDKNIHHEFYFNLQDRITIYEAIDRSLQIPKGKGYQFMNELTALEKMVRLEEELKLEKEDKFQKILLNSVSFDGLEQKNNSQKIKPMNHVERQALLAEMKKKDILSVAESLEMDLIKTGRSYKWKEHDSFVFDTRKNTFYWNSRGFGGDCIKLVQLMKECSFIEALKFLKEGEIKEHKEVSVERKFRYFLNDHDNIELVKQYLVHERKLDSETVDFFYKNGIIAQADYKNPNTNQYEPVLVFKNRDKDGNIKGVAIQGITKHEENGERAYVKRTLGDGYFGTKVTIGNPPITSGTRTSENPLKIIVFEAPIDLMSYYEIFKEKMGDCILLSMNGLRKESISTTFSEIVFPNANNEALRIRALDHVQKHINATNNFKFILAVDNDNWGKQFIENFNFDKFPVIQHLPKLNLGEMKSDWNQVLQQAKQSTQNKFYERVAQATTQYQRESGIEISQKRTM
ncbi:MAG: DUF3991 domain-containing protein [Granulicatella sp.]